MQKSLRGISVTSMWTWTWERAELGMILVIDANKILRNPTLPNGLDGLPDLNFRHYHFAKGEFRFPIDQYFLQTFDLGQFHWHVLE
jgi:hypothetical protein